jgi:hypothetical protein
MRQRRRRDVAVAWRQLLDGAGGEACEILGRPPQRGEDRPSRFVRERDRYLGAGGQRLEQRPLGPGEVLEAVGEDRLPVPRGEIRSQTLDGVLAQQAAIPPREPLELVVVAGIERTELALDRLRGEQPLVELAERALERVDEARMSRRAGIPVERCAADDTADEERLLHASELRTGVRGPERESTKQIVEGDDRAAEQRGTARQQLELDPVDVRPVRHDEHRLDPVRGVEYGEIAVEQEPDLARIRRARDEAERHPPTLARARDGL